VLLNQIATDHLYARLSFFEPLVAGGAEFLPSAA